MMMMMMIMIMMIMMVNRLDTVFSMPFTERVLQQLWVWPTFDWLFGRVAAREEQLQSATHHNDLEDSMFQGAKNILTHTIVASPLQPQCIVHLIYDTSMILRNGWM
jgi:hypothetical protein